MASIPKVTVAPGTEPVTAAELKSELIIDFTDDDTMITSKIKEARQYCEKYLGIKMINQTVAETFDHFDRFIFLSLTPIVSVTSLEYYVDGSYSTWASSNYIVDTFGYPGRIQVHPDSTIPTTDSVINKVKVTYVVGFGSNASDVPEDLKTAIKLKAASLYENRLDQAKRYHSTAMSYLTNWKNR